MKDLIEKYAKLLIDYSLDIQKGEKLYVVSTPLAEPLLRELYRYGMKRGADVVIDMSFDQKNKIFMQEADEAQLTFVNPMYKLAMETYDAYLVVRAPYNLRSDQNIDADKRKKRMEVMKPLLNTYFERTATRDLKRSLCQYPTEANAQEAGMTLEEYQKFIFNACRLYEDDPKSSWLEVRKEQQRIVDHLNQCNQIRYKNPLSDISFSVADRTWINSDGQTNMPSGEVFSGPVEDSVNGVIHFDYPSIYMGKEVRGITLEVENGIVQTWKAEKGGDILDEVFNIEGARQFGEVAIGTNYKISRATKNILFDEKIGGTIHMAVGQSYKQTGGKNQSSIHWDMIADMKVDSFIEADGEKIYENGRFLI